MSIASSSDSTDWNIELFPMDGLSDDENDDHHSNSADASDEHESESETEEKPKSFMTLRQRRLSKSLAPLAALKVNVNINRAHSHWLTAIRKAKVMADPWAAFHIEDMKSEQCIRHRYNPHKTNQWIQDEVTVRMEKRKKLSSFTRSGDWNHAMNYVAKRYIDNVDRDVYFQDVKLQMDAKVWGGRVQQAQPPKKVDIFQMYILEFKDRPGSPLYHLEHYIEGEYVKYNSNSGFVEETLRYTPQAFSHFTFERSGHKLIVVDIQGVGDLYTDPQIHTIDGKEYNEGNLGAKGMALFFHTHICNDICRSLDLTEFDLSPSEVTMHKDFLRSQRKAEMKTRIRGLEEHCLSLSPTTNKVDITRFLDRQRSTSSMFSDTTPDSYSNDDEPMSVGSPLNNFRSRIRSPSDTDSQSSMTIEDTENNIKGKLYKEERAAFSRMAEQRARPSCVALEKDLRKAMNLKIGDSILAKVHHEMAKYHEVGRFVTTENRNEIDVDWESAIFHELHAAELGELEAMVTMAKLYLGIERDVLVSCTVAENEEHTNSGVDFMVLAAEAGDRASMIFMAKAFESGLNLGTRRSISWEDAVYWYEQAAKIEETDEGGEYDSTIYDPTYQLVAKQAEMYLQGGHGLDKDAQRAGDLYNEAAELAMAAMKGRLANKYFSLSEEAYGEVEEEEEAE